MIYNSEITISIHEKSKKLRIKAWSRERGKAIRRNPTVDTARISESLEEETGNTFTCLVKASEEFEDLKPSKLRIWIFGSFNTAVLAAPKEVVVVINYEIKNQNRQQTSGKERQGFCKLSWSERGYLRGLVEWWWLNWWWSKEIEIKIYAGS